MATAFSSSCGEAATLLKFLIEGIFKEPIPPATGVFLAVELLFTVDEVVEVAAVTEDDVLVATTVLSTAGVEVTVVVSVTFTVVSGFFLPPLAEVDH